MIFYPSLSIIKHNVPHHLNKQYHIFLSSEKQFVIVKSHVQGWFMLSRLHLSHKIYQG